MEIIFLKLFLKIFQKEIISFLIGNRNFLAREPAFELRVGSSRQFWMQACELTSSSPTRTRLYFKLVQSKHFGVGMGRVQFLRVRVESVESMKNRFEYESFEYESRLDPSLL